MPLPSKKSSLPTLPQDTNTSSKKKIPIKKIDLSEEEVFTSLTIEEVEERDAFEKSQDEVYNSYEEEVQYEGRVKIPTPNYNEPIEEESYKKKDKFIDKKNKKIVPTGGEKSKAKAKDFDKRKNSLATLKLIRVLLGLFFIGIFGLGIKNTFFPEQIYTNDEISTIAVEAIGETGFPMDRGAAFGKEFLNYYLNSDTNDEQTSKILSRFYTGEVSNFGTESAVNKLDMPGTSQKPLSTPILFDQKGITESSAIFKYSVLVSNTDGQSVGEAGELTAHWLSFSINIYYDKDKDSMIIHPNSPTMIPNYNISETSSLPNASVIGNGEALDSIPEKMNSTIDGFIQAYAVSSINNHADIDQYIPKNFTPDLVSGFGGAVKLFDDKNTSISKDVFNTDESENIFKADIKVQWQDIQATGNGSVYYSRYILTIEKQNNGTYLVTKIAPYLFIPEEKAEE